MDTPIHKLLNKNLVKIFLFLYFYPNIGTKKLSNFNFLKLIMYTTVMFLYGFGKWVAE